MAITAAEIQARFTSQGADAVKSDITGVGRAVDTVRGKMSSWGQSARTTGTWLTAGLTVPIVGFFTKAIQGASSLEQAQGKVDAVFQQSANVVHAWSDTTSRAIGVSQTQALAWTGTIGNFFTSAGMTHDVSAKLSQDFVQLSADMGAFNDVSAARASDALIGGLAGEYDALQRLGVNITAAKVEQEAMNIATADGRDTITEADLALARYNVIMRETKTQQGQFARESKGFAGQLAILKARFSEVAAELGRNLLPYATDLIDKARDLVEWFGDLSPGAQRWALGLAAVAAAMGPLLVGIGLMLPGLGAMVGLFAALLSPIGLLVAGAGLLAFAFRDELGAAFDAVLDKVQFGITVFQNLRDAGLSPLQALMRTLIVLFPGLHDVVVPVIQAIQDFADAFDAIRQGDFSGAIEEIGSAFGHLWDAIMAAVDRIDWGAIGQSLWNGLLGIAGWIGGLVLDLGSIAVSVAGWLASTIPDIWDWLKGWVTGDNGGSLSLPSIIVNVAGWVAGAIASVWDFLNGHVMGGNKGDGTGGATDPGFGGVTIASVALNVLAWAKGAIPDAWTAIKGWVIGETGGVLSLPSIAVSVSSWVRGAVAPAFESIKSWVMGETGGVLSLPNIAVSVLSWMRGSLPDVYAKIEEWLEPHAINLTDAVITVSAPEIKQDWAPLTSKDIWWGKEGTWLRDIIDGEPGTFTAFGQTITVSMPTINQDWGPITSKDFWFGKPGTWLRNIIDGSPATHNTAVGGKITVGGPTFLQDWGVITSKDFWFGKPGTWLRNIIDGDPGTFTVGSGKVTIGVPELLRDWPSLTSKDFWLGKPGTWLRDLVDGATGSWSLPGPTIDIGMPDINWTGGGEKSKVPDGAAGALGQGALEGMDTLTYDPPPGLGGGGHERFMGAGGGFSGLAAQIGEQLAEVTRTIEQKTAEWGAALSAGLMPIPATTQAAFAPIPVTVGASLGAAAMATTLHTGTMRTVSDANFLGMRTTGTTNVLQLGASVLGSIAGTAAGWGASLAGMLGSATANFSAIRTTGTSNAATMGASVAASVGSMAANVGSRLGGMASSAIGTMSNMRGASVGQAISMGSGIAAGIGNGAANALSRLAGSMGQMAGVIASSGGAAVGTAAAVGANIGAALANGLASMAGRVAGAAANLIAQANAAISMAAGIASPSKLAIWWGHMLGEGFVVGIEDMYRTVAKATAGLVSTLALPGYATASPYAGTVPAYAMSGGGSTHYGTYDNRVIFEKGSIVQQPGEDGDALARRIVDGITGGWNASGPATARRR